MAIRPFITLSRTFAASIERDSFNVFQARLTESLIRAYNALGVTDRLRIHGIIDRENHIDNPIDKSQSPEEILYSIEKIYELGIEVINWGILDHMGLFAHLNKSAQVSPENFRMARLFECIEPHIAINLADALKDKPIAAHQTPPRPV